MEDSPVYVDLERTAIPHARPTVAYRIYRSIHPYSHATMTATKVALASLLAGAIGLALQLDRPDWAVVSVLLTLQWGPSRVPGTIRGVQRLVDSVAGIAFFALLHATGVEGWSLLAVLAVCQFFAEIFVVRNYAFCVIFTTPLALLMGGAGTAALGSAVVSRTTEVALAVTFALLMLWFWLPDAEPRRPDPGQRHSRGRREGVAAPRGHPAGRLRAARPLHAQRRPRAHPRRDHRALPPRARQRRLTPFN
ncbi:FUSC family protein [Corynebacterium frankenforstense]